MQNISEVTEFWTFCYSNKRPCQRKHVIVGERILYEAHSLPHRSIHEHLSNEPCIVILHPTVHKVSFALFCSWLQMSSSLVKAIMIGLSKKSCDRCHCALQSPGDRFSLKLHTALSAASKSILQVACSGDKWQGLQRYLWHCMGDFFSFSGWWLQHGKHST